MSYEKYTKSFKGFTSRVIARIKNRSRAKGIKFDLDTEWYRDKLSHGVCEVSGIKFDYNYESSINGTPLPFSPTIDRINPSLGYTKENCRVVVWIYNVCKQTYTDEDVMKLAKSLTTTKEI